jgi:hypothetical protein
MTSDSDNTATGNGWSLLRAAAPYVLPFALFAVLTYLTGILGLPPAVGYTVKTVLVAGCLIYFWKAYRNEMQVRIHPLDIAAGILVFVVWIGLEGLYPALGAPAGFNPYAVSSGSVAAVSAAAIRLLGAALVVPVMEELFWRSFAMRFLIDSNFLSVALGRFTWFSFLLVSLAFGLEHHRWLPGIIAGLVYAGLLCRSKNLFSPILAHGVTNLLLGAYVLATQSWQFW